MRRHCYVLCLALWMVPMAHGEAAEPKTDRHGDPLPEGVVTRLGTVRLRHASPVQLIRFAPDGKTVFSLGCGGTIRRWDVTTGKQIRSFHPGKDRPGARRAYWFTIGSTPQGGVLGAAPYQKYEAKTAVWGNVVAVWDADTGKLLWELNCPHVGDALLSPLVFSRDGKSLAVQRPGHSYMVYDLSSGKEVRKIQSPVADAKASRLSADLTRLATIKGDEVRIWDTATGKEVSRCEGHKGYARGAWFSADGKILLTSDTPHTVRLWDAASGKELWRRRVEPRPGIFRGPGDPHEPFALAFSGDGALLALGGPRTAEVQVWEVATGKLVHKLTGHKGGIVGVVFSPDGLTLASQGEYGVIRLWDLTSGQEIGQFDSDRSLSAHWPSIAFSPDGRTLAVGRPDTTVLLHDLTEMRKAGGKKELTEKEMESLWNDLGGADAGRAYEAIGKLAASAKTGVPFLARRLQPSEKVAPEQIARLIADLDADMFEARQRATKRLEKLGEAAEAELRKALAGNPPLEKRRRVEDLLARLEGDPLPPHRLRHLRALRALELIGTPEARRAVAELVKGTEDTWRKRQAQASLDRLNKRLSSKP